MRDLELLTHGWEFVKTPFGSDYPETADWQPVDIPHDWLIYDTNNLYEDSTGWYRRTITVPDDGRRTSVRFEGVYMDCRVYVNGVQAGEWKYGYTTFELDITNFIHAGDNLLTVRVDHKAPNSRWYSGAGINRRVWLNRFEQAHILPDGVYISADIDGTVTITTEVELPEGDNVGNYTLDAFIQRLNGDEMEFPSSYTNCTAADKSTLSQVLVRDGFRYAVTMQTIKVDKPILWDLDSPQIYYCFVALSRETDNNYHTDIVDYCMPSFGFRKTEITPDNGFFLNGRHVKLHGCCMHHDLGALGAAVNRSAIKRQLTKLREMGINAIRTSHNPPAVELMELADEMGFLILSEGFDMWELSKTDYDYARFFSEWHERDVAAWVRRDRNHPSLIGWSIGNEIYDTHVGERGQEVTSRLKMLVQSHDPRGNGFITIGSNYMSSDNARRCADILKIAGYNYSERLYDDHHEEYPDWAIFGSETSSVVESRGVYHFPLDMPILCEDDGQCSGLGNSAPAWASRSREANIIADRDRDFCAGQFIWTGFDYIGEPTPYSTKNSFFGQIDTAGFFKDGAYVYRAAWTDCDSAPFVHIFPHTDFNDGEMIDVRVASNAPRVELFFDGEMIAAGDFDRAHGDKITLDTKIVCRRGTLLAVAYDKQGREVAREEKPPFGDAVKIAASADRTNVPTDSDELIFIEITALDENGVMVENANDRVFVSVTGAGRLIGLDNGDSTDYEQYKGVSRRLFSGRLLAIVAPKKEPGEIKVRLTSPSLSPLEMIFMAYAENKPRGLAGTAENTHTSADCPDETRDIPVRGISLFPEFRELTTERRTVCVKAVCRPANSTYSGELEYRVTTVNGIDSPLAVITESGADGVLLEAKGDGEFCLRALCRNGTDRYRLFSQVRLTARGIGLALTDPYSTVECGLHGLGGGDVTTGLGHGAGIGVGGGWIGFENVDFGMVGSDTFTVALWANSNTPVRLRVYDGTPQDGVLLGDFEYSLKPIWQNYQSMTYRLSEPLRGRHTISFASDVRYDIGSFVFERRAKETAALPAALAESIYGDTFTVSGSEVTGIGNNVTLDFGEFDFAAVPKRLCITGRSALPMNSIHAMFSGSDGEKRIICEFAGAEGYTERGFELDGISGRQRVTLAFLPGSCFDLSSIRFEY